MEVFKRTKKNLECIAKMYKSKKKNNLHSQMLQCYKFNCTHHILLPESMQYFYNLLILAIKQLSLYSHKKVSTKLSTTSQL